jgi:hypothetical protein
MSEPNRPLGKIAKSLMAWAERHADPAEHEWIGAMRAEVDVIDGGLAQLRWAAGVVPLLWRSYRVDILRSMVCVTAVVAANYSFPKFVVTFQVFFINDGANTWTRVADPVELFFFAQQFYLPVVGILVAQATRRLVPGTVIGIGLSLLGLGVLHALGYGSASAPMAPANGSPSMYVEILFFALVGAAFGTLGATVGLHTSREAVVRGS